MRLKNTLGKVIGLLMMLVALVLAHSTVWGENVQPRTKVILDTDLDSDIDDMGALAMLLNMHKAGIIELKGIIITSDDPFAPSCANAMTTFYQLPDIPIGYLKDQPLLTNHSRYTRFIAEEFPHKINSWQDAEESTNLYRRLLAQNCGDPVVIVTIGHLTNLQRLLQSRPDVVSPLPGKELVSKNVNKWICMGGQFPQGKEANFYRPDPLSTLFCVNNWEKEVIFCGWEIGNKIITGTESLKSKLLPNHPLYRGYELYNAFAGRQSWDQIAVLLLTRPSDKFFSYHPGKCLVEADGSNKWQDDRKGKQKYVIFKDPDRVNDIMEMINDLMTGNISRVQGSLISKEKN